MQWRTPSGSYISINDSDLDRTIKLGDTPMSLRPHLPPSNLGASTDYGKDDSDRHLESLGKAAMKAAMEAAQIHEVELPPWPGKHMPHTAMRKIYMAALFSRRDEMAELSQRLIDVGYDVVSRWVYGGESGLSLQQIATLDLVDVRRADIVMAFTQPRGSMNCGGGRHFEMGYGFALGKRLVVIGEREHVFCHAQGVEVYPTLEAFLEEGR